MIFYKTVSSGNDFLHVNLEENKLKVYKKKGEMAKAICNRHSGAGADGIVFYQIQREAIDFEIFNHDGSEAELSGNGMAGVSALLFFLDRFSDTVVLNTKVGKRKVSLVGRSGSKFKLKVEMGEPNFREIRFFPFLENNKIEFSYKDIQFYPVSIGNPHLVVLLDKELPDQKLLALGKTLSEAPICPFGANVEFVRFKNENSCKVFFYERGVGSTGSSSTGSAAVFAVLQRLNRISQSLILNISNQKIRISGRKKIQVENFCEIVYKGMYLE
jgi:diaminopimelate epimerase